MVVPPKQPKMIIFSRKHPWLLGTTILGNPPNISPMDRSRNWEITGITVRPVEATDAALDAFAAVVRATVLAFAFLAAQLVYGPRSCW